MITVVYGLIILFATALGAIVGLGGGTIIKPAFDLIGHDSIDVVNFISSCCVFCMSIGAVLKHIKEKSKINSKFILTLSAGTVLGGILGANLFDYFVLNLSNSLLKSIQGIAIGVLLIVSAVYINKKNPKTFKIKNPVAIILTGTAMGFISSFLSIGEGTVNVMFLVLFFSMTVKEAADYSVCAIFFSQLTKLITTDLNDTVPEVSLLTIAVAIVMAVTGGAIGAKLNIKFSNKTIKIIFTVAVTVLSAINISNAVIGLTA